MRYFRIPTVSEMEKSGLGKVWKTPDVYFKEISLWEYLKIKYNKKFNTKKYWRKRHGQV